MTPEPRSERIHLLGAAPELAENVPLNAVEAAKEYLEADLVYAPRGDWDPPGIAQDALGCVVVSGFLVRTFRQDEKPLAELLGPNDCFRRPDDEYPSLSSRFKVIRPAEIAVLDSRDSAAVSRGLPQLKLAMSKRNRQREEVFKRLRTTGRARNRVVAALRHFATRWG
jgi:hypothetical protein